MRAFLSIGLSVQLAFSSVAALGVEAKNTKPKLDQKQALDRISKAHLDFIASQFSLVRNVEDFDRLLMIRTLKSGDRAAVLTRLKDIKDWPYLRRLNDSLVVALKGKKIAQIKPLDFPNLVFEINGRKLVYDSTQPLMPQIDRILDSKGESKSTAQILFNQLVPSANAVAPAVLNPIVTGIIGAMIATMLNDLIKMGWCATVVEKLKLPSEQCTNLIKAADEVYSKSEPALDAIVNLTGSENKNVVARFEVLDKVCPAKNDGKDREYRGNMRIVELKGGKKDILSNWFNVVAKFTPDGNPTEMIVTTEGTDPLKMDLSSREAKNKLIVHISFDPKTRRPLIYRMPNPAYTDDGDPLKASTIAISPNMRLTPEQVHAVDKSRDIVKVVNYRNYNCVVEDATEHQQAGIDPGSPAAPTPLKATETPAAVKN